MDPVFLKKKFFIKKLPSKNYFWEKKNILITRNKNLYSKLKLFIIKNYLDEKANNNNKPPIIEALENI